ncbi:ABC-F family ATP-binding cassette domain-containing protein [Gangjinia marincola]|uniref:ABC-F family ATP-binding cassette domain-containing protein n=1 Tax=Gangjinia marincola TaxID=578463 RepID=A0ABP3XSU6_9FLAO
MINIHNLSISFQGEYLFRGITFKLSPGDRIGLIGKNGAGKSTMLKILAQEIPSDEGDMALIKGTTIGFLKQDLDFEQGRTVLEEAYQAFKKIKNIEIALEEINVQLAERTDYESDSYNQLLIDLNDYQDQYEIIGGYNYQANTEKILKGLGFTAEDFDKRTETFSGGWRMRIELAKLLLQNNDVLLLDEPTNHLDIESIIWLEQFLRDYTGCVVIVSHDKMFLDNITNRTIEISGGSIFDFKKPYSKFMSLRDELIEQQLATQKNQQKEIERTEKLIEKFRAKASKATMAQSLIKKLDRMDRIEVDQQDTSVMNLSFPISVNPGKVVIEGDSITKSYGEKEVLSDVDLLVERSSKIAFVGQNGQGKSTLAKIIVNEIPFKGHLQLGHNVQVGYFAQNQSDYLDPKKSVHEIMIDAANEKNRASVRSILGAFLFQGDEVEKKTSVLSGGERNRLALAKLMLQPFNVLVMDEPTNHLDIASKEVLKTALKKFEGTLIVVSHDRDFLQGLTDKVYEFKDHQIKEYLGDIDYYLEQRNLEHLRDAEKATKPNLSHANKTESPALSHKDKKRQKALSNKMSNIEQKISSIEKDLGELDEKLANNPSLAVDNQDFLKTYAAKKTQLEEKMRQWEELAMQMER